MKKYILVVLFSLLFLIYFIFSTYMYKLEEFNRNYQNYYISLENQEVILTGQSELEKDIMYSIFKDVDKENNFIYYEVFLPTKDINIMIYDGDFKYLENKEYVKGEGFETGEQQQVLISEELYDDAKLEGLELENGYNIKGIYKDEIATANNIDIIIPVEDYMNDFFNGYDDIVINATSKEIFNKVKNEIIEIVSNYDEDIDIVTGLKKEKNFKNLEEEMEQFEILKKSTSILMIILIIIIGWYQIKLKSYEYGVRNILGIKNGQLLVLIYKDYFKELIIGIGVGYLLYYILYTLNNMFFKSNELFTELRFVINWEFLITIILIVNVMIFINYVYFYTHKGINMIKED